MFKFRLKFLILLTALIILIGCTSGKEQYVSGMQAAERGDLRVAIEKFNQALAKRENPKYRQALESVQAKLADELLQQAAESTRQKTIPGYTVALKSLDEAIMYNPRDVGLHRVRKEYIDQLIELKAEVLDGVEVATIELEKGDWKSALNQFKDLQKYDPLNLTILDGIQEARNTGIADLNSRIDAFVDAEDWRNAKEEIVKLLILDPDNTAARQKLKECEANDNLGYFMSRGDAAYKGGNYDEAFRYYKIAQKYDSKNPIVQDRIIITEKFLVDQLYQESEAMMQFRSWKRATDLLEKINEMEPGYKNAPLMLVEAKSRLVKIYMDRCMNYQNSGMWGNAYIWAKKIERLDPNYVGLRNMTNKITNILKNRLYIDIGLLDFEAPRGTPRAGDTVAASILSIIMENKPEELRFMDRKNLQNILAKQDMIQDGKIKNDKIREIGRSYGIEFLISGSVLKYKVDRYDHTTIERARVKIGTKTIINPEYKKFEADYPDGIPPGVTPPPQYIEEPRYSFIPYEIKYLDRVAVIETSFRIIDIDSGEVKLAHKDQSKKQATGRISPGVNEAGIPPVNETVPPDVELMQTVTWDIANKIAGRILAEFNRRADDYYAKGEKFRREASLEKALEEYINNIVAVEQLGAKSFRYEDARRRIESVLVEMEKPEE